MSNDNATPNGDNRNGFFINNGTFSGHFTTPDGDIYDIRKLEPREVTDPRTGEVATIWGGYANARDRDLAAKDAIMQAEFKRTGTRPETRVMLTRSERKAQGLAAEERFRAWLDRCHLPQIFVEQSPMTLPATLKGEIKRPDFLVGIPAIGTIAVDVKAKSIYDDTIIIDAYEHRTLMNFEMFFCVSVWFACFPPGEPHTCLLVLNRNLAGLPTAKRQGREAISVPLTLTRLADERRDFLAALMGAVSLR